MCFTCIDICLRHARIRNDEMHGPRLGLASDRDYVFSLYRKKEGKRKLKIGAQGSEGVGG